MHRPGPVVLVACTVALVVGCAAGKPGRPQFTGYLGDYSKLEPVTGEGGEEIRRWVNPRVARGAYQKLLVDPIVFHPAPRATRQVSVETLLQIRRYADEALRRELARSFLLVHQVGPGVARVRFALTGITVPAAGPKVYEHVPIVRIATGAAGERGGAAFLLVEGEVLDSLTQEHIGMAVHQIPGDRLVRDEQEPLTAERMRPVIDARADNARRILDRVLR